MSDLLEYDENLTRILYRAIATHNDEALNTLRQAVRKVEGMIGNTRFVDLEVRERSAGQFAIFCERHRLQSKDINYFTSRAQEIDESAWDGDGVWIPARIEEGAK